jgi:hypothetical protein
MNKETIMNQQDKQNQPTPRPVESRPPKKRFRIEKLEERVAPSKGGNGTNNCITGRGCSSDSGSSNSVVSFY